VACEVRALLLGGETDAARERYGTIVELLQRRASRLAFFYLRDAAEADEAVQDAFVRAYTNLGTFDDQHPFEVWFTRILVNGCLDRIKARRRRARWLVPSGERDGRTGDTAVEPVDSGETPEEQIVARERRRALVAAIDRLPDRQRTVVLLSHLDGRSTREISLLTGLSESTVRVHLFRAVRRLRQWLAGPERAADATREGAR
jgi:RNA polymerase sigma-70 factor (ECF subfamily)